MRTANERKQICTRNNVPNESLMRTRLRENFMPKHLVKFRVKTKYNGITTVWLTSKGYMIEDTANKWFDYMSDNYIATLRAEKQIA